MSSEMPTPSGWFPTTAWSLIKKAQDPGHADHRQARDRLLARYWKPVFCFVRARGYPVHAAEDLTQDFFLQILERDWLQPADPDRGRFRNFLLRILTRFLADQGPKRAPRQKGFEQRFVAISGLMGDEERTYEPPSNQTPESVFMKQWAVALVGSILQQLRRFYEEQGRADWYEMFAAVHFAERAADCPSQQELAERFGVTRDQVRYALEMVQKRFIHYLRAEVRDQVGSEAEVGEEIGELMELLAN